MNHIKRVELVLVLLILTMKPFPVFAGVHGDMELLKTVALANKANFESILTWRSEIYEERKATVGNSYKRTLNSQCIMVYDQLEQAVRWNKTPQEYFIEEEGKRKIDETDSTAYYQSSMFKKASYYNYKGNWQPKDPNNRFYILVIDDAKKAKGLGDFSFDPRLLLTLNGMPFYERLIFLYEHVKDSDPVAVYVSRTGDLVTLEFSDKDENDKYVFDLSVGGNLVEWYNKANNVEHTRKCTYENKSGSWVLKTYYKTYADSRQEDIATTTRLLKFDNSVVNIPFKDDEFTIDKMGIKNGGVIQDHIAGISYKYDGTFIEPLLSPKTLIGQQFPQIKELGINLSPADVNDKSILVCFFELQQRPSRNCIMQLSKRANDLKVKDIVVVAIQASKVEQGKLDEWVKENNIPFPVGMIKADEEKTRFNWGVRSLPWLILTDRKHIVQAEGFGINELDERVTTLTEK